MELSKKTTRTIASLLAFGIILVFALNNWKIVTDILGYVNDLLFPFILGGCIAFIMNLPMKFFMKKLSNLEGKSKVSISKNGLTIISLLLSCIMIIGIIALLLYLVVPQLVATAKILPGSLKHAAASFKTYVEHNKWLSTMAASWVNKLNINWDTIISKAKSTAFSGSGSMISSTLGVATSFTNGLVDFALGLIFALYVLLQKDRLEIQFKKSLYAFFPNGKVDSFLNVLELTGETFGNFISGKCMEAVILGLMFLVSMIIFKLPYAFVISAVIGCASLIPIVGSLIGFTIGVFLIVMISPASAGLFIIIFCVIHWLEGHFIYPKVVGESVGLPAMWVLVAITIGGKVMGVVGMMISVPLFSVAYALFRKDVHTRLNNKKMVIQEPTTKSA